VGAVAIGQSDAFHADSGDDFGDFARMHGARVEAEIGMNLEVS
jgi:hypothetical protein